MAGVLVPPGHGILSPHSVPSTFTRTLMPRLTLTPHRLFPDRQTFTTTPSVVALGPQGLLTAAATPTKRGRLSVFKPLFCGVFYFARNLMYLSLKKYGP